MSDQTPTNDQHHTVAPESDNDSVMALALRVNGMKVDGSSSPVVSTASSQVGAAASATSDSDVNDDTIVKESVVEANEEDDEEGPLPFFDKDGNPCDENTPANKFMQHSEYLPFCDHGPKFIIRLAIIQPDGTTQYRKVKFSKKLLCDAGAYFGGLARTQMIESTRGYVDLDDVNLVDFNNVMTIIRSGQPLSNNKLGQTYRTFSDYLEIYILADRFIMPLVKAWAVAAMEHIMGNGMHWAALYQHEVIDHSNPVADATHQEKVLDFNDVWVRINHLPNDNQPIERHRIVKYLLNYCPRLLLRDTMRRMHPELVREVCIGLLSG